MAAMTPPATATAAPRSTDGASARWNTKRATKAAIIGDAAAMIDEATAPD
jgi:hypothetical protein